MSTEDLEGALASANETTSTPTSTEPSSNDVASSVMEELDQMAGISEEPKEDTKTETAEAGKETTEAEKSKEDRFGRDKEDQTKSQSTPRDQDRKPTFQEDAGILETFFQEDKSGNLVDKNGAIVATAGASRRYFEAMKRAGRFAIGTMQQQQDRLQKLQSTLQGLHNDYNKIKDQPTKDRFSDLSISEDETNIIRRLIPMFRDDPQAGIKALLTEVSARGTDLSKMGMQDTLHVGTVRNMIKEAVAEATKKQDIDTISAQPNSQPQTEADFVREAQEFLGKYPEAARFDQQIAEAARRFPQMSLEQIWNEMRKGIKGAQERRALAQQNKAAKEQEQKTTDVRPQVKPTAAKATAKSKPEAKKSYNDLAADILKEMAPNG